MWEQGGDLNFQMGGDTRPNIRILGGLIHRPGACFLPQGRGGGFKAGWEVSAHAAGSR